MRRGADIYDEILEFYFKEIGDLGVLSPEEERELLIRAKKGDREAIEKLVIHNLKFVVHIAKQYAGYGIPLSDLINEGNLGLLKAIQRFDPKKGVRFLSYAIFWIRQAILRTLHEQMRLVRVPRENLEKAKRIREVQQELEERLGETPSLDEIAKELDLSPDEVVKAQELFMSEISLDQPLFDENEKSALHEILASTSVASPEEFFKQEEIQERVVRMIEKALDPREAQILKWYFGIGVEEPMTLEEIGKKLGITRERVRQLKERALRKLRNRYGESLRGLLD